jgi:hypothetical protein
MARVIAITDSHGELLGVVRGDPVETDNGLLQAFPLERPDEVHHVLDVPSEILSMPLAERHQAIRVRLRE